MDKKKEADICTGSSTPGTNIRFQTNNKKKKLTNLSEPKSTSFNFFFQVKKLQFVPINSFMLPRKLLLAGRAFLGQKLNGLGCFLIEEIILPVIIDPDGNPTTNRGKRFISRKVFF